MALIYNQFVVVLLLLLDALCNLTMLCTQRHGRVSSFGTEEQPGYDCYSWLMRTSSSFCSWDGSSLTYLRFSSCGNSTQRNSISNISKSNGTITGYPKTFLLLFR